MATHNGRRRPIGITIGDPAGVGPEVILRALASHANPSRTPVVVIGSIAALQRGLDGLDLPLELVSVQDFERLPPLEDHLVPVFDVQTTGSHRFPVGVVDADCGRASIAYMEAAASLAQDGRLAGLVTAPINKQAVQLAGYRFVDQAEFFATAMGIKPAEVTTMVASGKLRAFLVTKHIPLSAVVSHLTAERIVRVTNIANETMSALIGTRPPKLIAASVNPHAGEGGLIGHEEIDIIKPAVDRARADGIDITGPIPGKSAFRQMMDGRADGVIAMYHDQTAPIELMSGQAYTVTLGLPIVRTSVGHGTAFDIAGKGLASPSSMLEALAITQELVARR